MNRQPKKPLPLPQPWLLASWAALGAAILGIDYLTGPNVAIPYLFLVPVVLAARYNGEFCAITLATILALTRFGFHFAWDDPHSLWDAVLNTAIRAAILVSAASLVGRVMRQAREIRILRGFLPICSFCKKIRTPDQKWQAIETYISEHSEATFTHTFCPECGREHYGKWMTGKEVSAGAPDPSPVNHSDECKPAC